MHVRIRRVLATSAVGVLLAAGSVGTAYADDISNTIDATVDAAAEQMALTAGGANGSTTLVVAPTNGDGKQGCNLTAQTTATFELDTSNAAAATVSPASVTFGSCGEVKTVTVTPHAVGSASITLQADRQQHRWQLQRRPGRLLGVGLRARRHEHASRRRGHRLRRRRDLRLGTTPAQPPARCRTSRTAAVRPAQVTPALDALGIGTTTVTCTYTDRGGLTSSASASYSTADTLAPTIERVSVLPAANGAGWNNSPVTAAWACADLGTGVVSETVSETTAGEGASLALTGTCTDRAGHSVSDTVDGIDVDLTAPVISIGRNPAANAAGWNNGDVTVAWTCAVTASFTATDATSGCTAPTRRPLARHAQGPRPVGHRLLHRPRRQLRLRAR